ncbi:MFS transporter [Altererythrobacter sp. MF3-039]|uniref:MFS transporter n=1 Tax=Altererythrobacter sp. MF3-039 TaxID=3252901 RepID=UPI00390C9F5E
MNEAASVASLKGYPTKAFVVCLIAYAFAQMDLALFGYAIPQIREEFGLSLPGVMGIVSTAFVLGGLLIVALAVLTDRLGRRRMFQLSFIGSSLLVTLHMFAPNPATLSVLRGSSIAVGGLSYPVTGAVVSEEFPARWRGFFLGLLQIGYPLGWFVASLWAAWILTDYGWRMLFLVGLISIPFIFVINRVIREPARFQRASECSYKARVRDLFAPGMARRTSILFFAQFLFVWAYAGSIFLLPSFLAEDRGFDPQGYSLFIGIGNLVGVLGYIGAAYVGEFVLNRRDTVVIWTLAGSFAFQFLIWGPTGFAASLAAYSLMAMFFYGTAAAKFAYVAEIFPTRLRATGVAFCGSFAVTLGSASGPLAASFIAERYGWDIGLSVVVGTPLFLAGLLYFLLARVPSGLEVEEVQTFLEKGSK